MKRSMLLSFVLLLVLALAQVAAAQGGALVVRRVAQPPVIDGSPDDAAWQTAIRYPFAFNQLDSFDQVWTDLEDFNASFRLAYYGNTLYGIVYRHDDFTALGNPIAFDNDSVELFFTFDGYSITQLRAIVWEPFAETLAGNQVQAAWSEDGSVFEFAVDLGSAGVRIVPGSTLPFNIAINESDGTARKIQLYPFAGHNRSWTDPAALGMIVFE